MNLTSASALLKLIISTHQNMTDEDIIDIKQELENLLAKLQPNLQDVIKRSFTNVVLQQTKKGEKVKPDVLDDTSYFSKNTQVNLSRLEFVKNPSFHILNLSLDLQSMGLTLRCSLGDVDVKGIYSAYNENLYNLLPVMAEGHVLITLSNVVADVSVGLVLKDDAFSFINPGVDFLHEEVLVKLSWPSPQRNGGYEFLTTELLAKHIDDLPLTAAISLPLRARLQQRLLTQLEQALGRAVSVSDLVGCNAPLLEAYNGKVEELASLGNKVVDLVLINVRRTLLQGRVEVVDMPPLHATFLHRVGSSSFVGKFETDTGWLKNLSTINRVCDVSVSRPDPNKTTFRVTLRIKDLQIGFDEYRIKALGLGCGGRLAAAFGDNRIHLALSVGLARWEPYSQLDQLTLQCLDDMDLHITGLGSLSALSPLLRGWVRGAAAAAGSRAITTTLHTQLHTALRELLLWDIANQKRS